MERQRGHRLRDDLRARQHRRYAQCAGRRCVSAASHPAIGGTEGQIPEALSVIATLLLGLRLPLPWPFPVHLTNSSGISIADYCINAKLMKLRAGRLNCI